MEAYGGMSGQPHAQSALPNPPETQNSRPYSPSSLGTGVCVGGGGVYGDEDKAL